MKVFNRDDRVMVLYGNEEEYGGQIGTVRFIGSTNPNLEYMVYGVQLNGDLVDRCVGFYGISLELFIDDFSVEL
jgi:hypothetical protein